MMRKDGFKMTKLYIPTRLDVLYRDYERFVRDIPHQAGVKQRNEEFVKILIAYYEKELSENFKLRMQCYNKKYGTHIGEVNESDG